MRKMTGNGTLLAKMLLLIFPLFAAYGASGQFTQTVRGKIVEQVLQKPLEGATVSVPSLGKSVITQSDGTFRITGVPVGIHQIAVSYIGFREAVVENVVVNSGKEVVITIPLEEDMDIQKEVEITAKSKKNRPLNDMSMVSARAFTVEETQKYAAAVNDPLRMATSFAGVVSAEDGNNDIVIRGNAPGGLLWRMEGVDIPNPNHFSNAGSSGGGISILSAQLLANSDFITGAFSAEYGNALSGVFDLRLRKGNNEKREYTVEAGLLGLNVAAEGPLSPRYKGSYLVNYRYSTLQMLSKLGLDVVDGGVTNFQDLSFNIYLPTAAGGEFTLFGFGGLSDQKNTNERDPSLWEEESDRYGGTFKANTAALGATHSIPVGNNAQLRSAVSLSYTDNDYNQNYTEDEGTLFNSFRNTYKTRKVIVSSTLNYRFGNRSSLRAGIIANDITYNYFQKSWEHPGNPVIERINTSDNTQTLQGFAQWQYKASRNLTLQGGAHYLRLFLNNSSSIEPRASIKYAFDRKNEVSIGYGLHSQVQPLGVYFAKAMDSEAPSSYPNKDLSFTRAHHFVISYSHAFNKTLRVRSDIYYQKLFDVPVSIYDSITFSTLNIRGDYITEALVNSGKGRNYGIDISVEKNLANDFYMLFNQSFYRSKYTASDGVERDTRFNGNFISNFTGGREWILKEGKRTIGANIKLIYAGGFRNTPIDIEQSSQKGYAVYKEKEAFTLQKPA